MAALALLVGLMIPLGMWGQNPVNGGEMTRTETVVTWTATAANNFGSTISQVNGTKTGSINTGSFSWNYVNTLTYLKSGKSDHQSFLNTGFIQIGSSNAYHRLELSTSEIPGTIKSVSVECSSASGAHKLTIAVGSTKYKDAESTPSGQPTENGNYVVTGTGNASGSISILLAPGSGALYIKSISVTYEETNLAPTTTLIDGQYITNTDLNQGTSAGYLVAEVYDENDVLITDADVTWDSTDEDVATISQDGVVTLVGVGTTTITATFEGDATNATSFDTYELTVINTAPWVTATPSTLNSFSYAVNLGPSVAQTISIEGAYLASNVTVELDGAQGSSFEISQDGTTWTNSIVLAPTRGAIASTNISVRMKAGLVVDSYSDVLRVKYNNSNMVSINLSGSVDTIMTVTEVLSASTLPSGTVYVSGIVSSFFGDNILDDGNNYRYYISEDGVEEDEIRVYKGKGLNNQQFANVDDVLIGDHVIICGELSVYNDMVQFNANNFIVSLTRPDSYTLTVSSLSHAEMFVFAGNSSEMLFEGVGSGSVIEGASVVLSVEPEYGYELSSLMVDGEEHVNDINSGAYVFNMPSHDVEVTVATTRLAYYTVTFKTNGVLETTMDIVQGDHISDAGTLPTVTNDYIPAGYEFMGWYAGDYAVSNTAPATYITDAFEPQGNVTVNAVFAEVVTPGTPDTWTKITDLSTVTAGVYALIDADGYAFNGSMSSGHGQHTAATFSFTNNVATSAPTGTCELTLTASGNGFTMYNSAKGFLYASKAGSGGLAWHSSEDNYWYYDEVNDQDNWIYSKSYNGSNAMLRVYDHTFRTYAANNNNPVYMAKKTAGAPAEYGNYRTSLTETSNPLVITGYGQNAGGYYLIASPVYVSPSSVTNMLANSYDLYYFDQNNDLEWRNYKQNAFNLEPGKGYLYANSNTVSLTFNGTAYNGTGEITLTQGSGKWANWNLIGNPWTNDAILQDGNGTNANNVAYYTMNQDGDELAAGTTGATIAAMNGVFVEAATDGQVVYFNEVASAPGGEDVTPQVSLNITKNRGCLIDRAIVRFDEGGVLHKFQLNPNNTKIYITEVNQDYAVVRGANEGELPVNFKAKENGTYTLSVNIENVEMNYLHLIDNMTGADIDLLQTPSYTFDANVNDYESRFRLVFSANNGSNDNGNETFAYYNGSEWMINNIGDATLQVVDVMGRILSNQTISGNTSTTLNTTPGVYMLRLINGENVKVQKVVVR